MEPSTDPTDPMQAWLLEILAEALVDDLESPHVVLCHGHPDDHCTVSGPYPTALAALAAADAEERRNRADGEEAMSFTVTALLRPLEREGGA